MIRYMFLALFIFSSSLSMAQTLKLVNSTRRDWSGGVAGRHGINYEFTIECPISKRDPIPDTLWIDGKAIPLNIATEDGSADPHITITRTKKKVRFEIRVGLSYDDNLNRPGQPMVRKAIPPRPYKGIALLSYTYAGITKYFEITKIFVKYPPVDYP